MNKSLLAGLVKCFSKSIITLFFSLIAFFSNGQIKFSASVDSKTIGKNDYLQIQFTIENAAHVESIMPPSFKDFRVISGPNQQSSLSNINGNVKQAISIGFVLRPLATGNFTIGSAKAKADGKEYHSNPVAIQVNNSSSNKTGNTSLSPFGNITLAFPSEPVTHQFDEYILQKGENIAEKIKKNLFLKIDVSKKNCFVGEPIIATYKLFTRLKSESNVVKAPSFNGFSVSELEMPDNYSLTTEKYNGRQYNVYTLRKVQLYPLQPGTLSLEPVEVKNMITFIKAEYARQRKGDIFYDLLRDFADENTPGSATEQQAITVTCDTLHIQVKPLPEANNPPFFKGAVGDFKMVSSLEKNNITTDDAGSLKVTLSGAGNIQLVNAPTVSWPQGMEGFESKALENLDKFSVPIKGEKTFVYPFTISDPGNYLIPAINFSYFDINTQLYKTISTQPLSLHVVKGTGNSTLDARKLKIEKVDGGVDDSNFKYRWYLGGVAIILITVLIFLFNKKNQKKFPVKTMESPGSYQPDPVEEAAFNIPSNPLAEAEKKLLQGDTSEFYRSLDVLIHKYLSVKLKIPEEELTRKKINERMDKCNVGVGTTLLVNSLLADIELNLYAPVSSKIQMEEVYGKASEIVSLLDKQLC